MLIAAPDGIRGGGPLVCGIENDDPASLAAARTAGRLARALRRRLVLVHVGRVAARAENPEPSAVTAAVAGHLPVDDVETVLVEGAVAEALEHVAEARGAPLLVVGSHGGGAIQALVGGAISLELARRTRRPLVIASEAIA